MTYGLYSAFITVAQNQPQWPAMGAGIVATSFLAMFILPTIASAVNDTASALWALAVTARQGKLSDFAKTVRSRPGLIMVAAALVGGPLATTAYIIALSQAGPMATPVAALNVAAGAVLGRVLLKQKMGPRVVLGVLVCLAASVMIGSTALTGDVAPGLVTGLVFALVAAVGWGLEGCIAGFGTAMIDSQIGITIRQCTSGLANLMVLLPVLSLVGGKSLGATFGYVGQVVASPPILVLFLVSGFFAYVSFASWYISNSMCGAALGMALNGTYTFFGPLFTWVILGVVMGLAGYEMSPVAWVAALVMMAGIFIIAVNPLDFFKKGKEQ
ncbi:hypothetical protein [Caniella muris]|uniref:hypothetical protein n=1 Tax=Caniella muris TaxID=2941502 RepID=UPI00203CFC5E|nr:hypothetical protein [Caniella muris]